MAGRWSTFGAAATALVVAAAVSCGSSSVARDSDSALAAPTTEAVSPAPTTGAAPDRRPGEAAAYDELIDRLTDDVPPRLQATVPWPDLRSSDPAVAQIEIFDLWVWMAEHHPSQVLADAVAHPGSPAQTETSAIFGWLDRRGERHKREDDSYRVLDQRVLPLDDADLPNWITRDVPDGSVAIWYTDVSGPFLVVDADDGTILEDVPAIGPREWLAILSPSEVGWRIWRDELIEAGDNDLGWPGEAPTPQRRTDV